MPKLAENGGNIDETQAIKDRRTIMRISRERAEVAKDDLRKTHAFFPPEIKATRKSEEQLIVRETTNAVEKQQIDSRRTLRGIIPEPQKQIRSILAGKPPSMPPSSRRNRRAMPSQQFQAVQQPASPIKEIKTTPPDQEGAASLEEAMDSIRAEEIGNILDEAMDSTRAEEIGNILDEAIKPEVIEKAHPRPIPTAEETLPSNKVVLSDLFADGREDVDHRSSISPLPGLTTETLAAMIAEAEAEAEKKTPIPIPKVDLLDPVLPKLGKTVQIDPSGLPKTPPSEYLTTLPKTVQERRKWVSKRTKSLLASIAVGAAIGITALGTLKITGKMKDVNSAIDKVFKTPNK